MWQWIKNPGLNVVLGLFGAVGTIFGFYAHFAAKVYRDPAFTSHAGTVLSVPADVGGVPVRLVDATTGEPISGYVIDQRFTLHNRGTQPIRSENILVPLVIEIKARNLKVLSARVSAVTRNQVVQPRAELRSDGRVAVGFAILEPNDGFEITAVFTSTDSASTASIQGTIEGVSKFSENQGPIVRGSTISITIFSLLGLGIIAAAITSLRSNAKKTGWTNAVRSAATEVGVFVLIIALVFTAMWGLGRAFSPLIEPRVIQPPEMTEILPPPLKPVSPPASLTIN